MEQRINSELLKFILATEVKVLMSQRPNLELIPVSLAWSIPRSIASPPWMDASPSQGYPQQYIILSMSPVSIFSKIELVVYYQYLVLIGWATTSLYVIAH